MFVSIFEFKMFVSRDTDKIVMRYVDSDGILAIYNTCKYLRNAIGDNIVLHGFSNTHLSFPPATSGEELIALVLIDIELKAVTSEIELSNGFYIAKLIAGSRVTNSIKNYIVIGRFGGTINMLEVDIYGYILDDTLVSASITSFNGKDCWTMLLKQNGRQGKYMLTLEVYPGILLYENGPQITSMTSIYLRYRTLVHNLREIAPEVGTLSSIRYMYLSRMLSIMCIITDWDPNNQVVTLKRIISKEKEPYHNKDDIILQLANLRHGPSTAWWIALPESKEYDKIGNKSVILSVGDWESF